MVSGLAAMMGQSGLSGASEQSPDPPCTVYSRCVFHVLFLGGTWVTSMVRLIDVPLPMSTLADGYPCLIDVPLPMGTRLTYHDRNDKDQSYGPSKGHPV